MTIEGGSMPDLPSAPNERGAALSELFRPTSVVVVGASNDPRKLGSRIIPNLQRLGFRGDIYPVNPSGDTISGLTTYTSPSDVPRNASVAYLLVPAEATVDAVAACADRGVRFAIIAAAGFSEQPGEAGGRRQQALADVSRRTGIRVVGPNCNGIFNVTDGVSIGFNTSHCRSLRSGPLAVVSHSGALFTSIGQLSDQHHVGLSKFVSVGNEVDLTVLDYFHHLLDDDATQIIGLVLDGIKDGPRFRDLCLEAKHRGKSVVVLKFGDSAAGSAAAVAHSSRLAGESRATDALLETLGVGRVASVEAMIVASKLLACNRQPRRRPGVGGYTLSGAAGSILADAAEHHGVPMATFSDTTRSLFDGHERMAQIVNPVDMGAVGDISQAPVILTALAGDENVSDLVVTPHDAGSAASNAQLRDTLTDVLRTTRTRLTVLAPGGLEGIEDDLRAAGAVVARDTETAMAAMAAAHRSEQVADWTAPPATTTRPDTVPHLSGALTELESLTLLRDWGVPTVDFRVVADEHDAVAAFGELGPSVVIKGIVRGVSHKSDLGLVDVGLCSEAAVRSSYRSIRAAVADVGGGDVLVETMAKGRAEILVGVTRDAELGHFVVIGLGGVFAEDLDNVVLLPVGVGAGAVRARLQRSAVGRVLWSARWKEQPAERVLEVVAALGRMAQHIGERLVSIDINPLVLSDGSALAADALVVLNESLSAPTARGDAAVDHAPTEG
jgi:acyl-CoA synthetase (NDP forming)